MRELVQKLFLNGKMITPQAISVIKEHNLKIEDILKINSDIIDHNSLTELVKKPNGSIHLAERIIPNVPGISIQTATILPQETPKVPEPPALSSVEVRRDRKKTLAEEYSVDFKIENGKITSRERKSADFINYFNSRFSLIQGMLVKRLNPMSISNITKSNAESINMIGMVSDIRATNNGNKLIELEDPTGRIMCFISKDKNEDLFEESNNILMDEVLGVSGSFKNGLFFVKEIIRPDVPITNQINKIDVPVKAVFISDIHYASSDFLDKPFTNFIRWLRSEKADAVKYVFVAGDLCDGIGIYLGQEKELTIKDGQEQYLSLAARLSEIPEHIKIIVSPGNHDIIGNHEPQQTLDFTALAKLPNVVFATNPATVILQNKLRILMYHGYSYDEVIAELPKIRHDGYDKPCLPMLEVLKRRHLSPVYGGSLVIPDGIDRLVIDKVPDIFHSGHLHTVGVDNYRGVTLINSGTFQGRTSFQEKMGHHPHPGIFANVDLMTRKVELVDVN